VRNRVPIFKFDTMYKQMAEAAGISETKVCCRTCGKEQTVNGREGRSAVGGSPLDTVDKSRQSPPLSEIEKAALIRQARESKKAGLELMGIEKRALQEIGEEPPDPPDTFDDNFPEAT
jgi:hypothetical protein